MGLFDETWTRRFLSPRDDLCHDADRRIHVGDLTQDQIWELEAATRAAYVLAGGDDSQHEPFYVEVRVSQDGPMRTLTVKVTRTDDAQMP